MTNQSIKLNAWDLNYESQIAVQGEVNSRTLSVTLIDKTGTTSYISNAESVDRPIDLTGVTARLYVFKLDGTKTFSDGTITDMENGKVDFILPAQATTYVGKNPCQILLTKADNSALKITGLTLDVQESDLEGAIESTDDFSALVVALNSVAASAALAEETIAAANQAAATANTAATSANSAATSANTAATTATTATTAANLAKTNADTATTNSVAKTALAVTATVNAITATGVANTAASTANDKATLAVTATSNADTATTDANTATGLANAAATSANAAATSANAAAISVKNMPYIGEDGYWYEWNSTTGSYEKSNSYANSAVSTFNIDLSTGMLIQTTPENYNGAEFQINDGNLEVVINA